MVGEGWEKNKQFMSHNLNWCLCKGFTWDVCVCARLHCVCVRVSATRLSQQDEPCSQLGVLYCNLLCLDYISRLGYSLTASTYTMRVDTACMPSLTQPAGYIRISRTPDYWPLEWHWNWWCVLSKWFQILWFIVVSPHPLSPSASHPPCVTLTFTLPSSHPRDNQCFSFQGCQWFFIWGLVLWEDVVRGF